MQHPSQEQRFAGHQFNFFRSTCQNNAFKIHQIAPTQVCVGAYYYCIYMFVVHVFSPQNNTAQVWTRMKL